MMTRRLPTNPAKELSHPILTVALNHVGASSFNVAKMNKVKITSIRMLVTQIFAAISISLIVVKGTVPCKRSTVPLSFT